MKATKSTKPTIRFSVQLGPPGARVPADLRDALCKSPKAEAVWNDITPIARRDWIFWLSSAKQEETRLRRIEKACDMLASGHRRVCCFGGINWLMKSAKEKREKRG